MTMNLNTKKRLLDTRKAIPPDFPIIPGRRLKVGLGKKSATSLDLAKGLTQK
jgi:hypothetical protein